MSSPLGSLGGSGTVHDLYKISHPSIFPRYYFKCTMKEEGHTGGVGLRKF